jgi:hypothetical protein
MSRESDARDAACAVEYDVTGDWSAPDDRSWECASRGASLASHGDRIRRWKKQNDLGSGAAGSVASYETHRTEHRPVAVKRYSSDATVTCKFVRELVLRDLDHPNIIKIGGAGIDRNGPFLAMNSAAVNLRTFLDDQAIADGKDPARAGTRMTRGARVTPLTYDDARVMVYQLLRALNYLQSMLIAHTDLHDGNILVTDVPISTGGTFHRMLFADFERATPLPLYPVSDAADIRFLARVSNPVVLASGAMVTDLWMLTGAMTEIFSRVSDDDGRAARARLIGASTAQHDHLRWSMPAEANAAALLNHAMFRTEPLADAKYVALCTRAREAQISPSIAWPTPADFVELALPEKRALMPVNIHKPTADNVLWALLSYDGLPLGTRSSARGASRAPKRATVADRDTYVSVAWSVLDAVIRGIGAVRPPMTLALLINRHVRALQFCRRCAAAGALADHEAQVHSAASINDLAAAWLRIATEVEPHTSAQEYPAAVTEATAGMLRAVDFDVHHPTVCDYVFAYVRRGDAPVYLSNDRAWMCLLAMLDWEVSARPARVIARVVVALSRAAAGMPDPWRPDGYEDAPVGDCASCQDGHFRKAVAAAIVKAFRVLDRGYPGVLFGASGILGSAFPVDKLAQVAGV